MKLYTVTVILCAQLCVTTNVLPLCAHQTAPETGTPGTCYQGTNSPTTPNAAQPVATNQGYCFAVTHLCTALEISYQNTDCKDYIDGDVLRTYTAGDASTLGLLRDFGDLYPEQYGNILVCNTADCNDPEADPCADGTNGDGPGASPDPTAAATPDSTPSASTTYNPSAAATTAATPTATHTQTKTPPAPSSAPALCAHQSLPSAATSDVKCWFGTQSPFATPQELPALEVTAHEGAVYCVAVSHLCDAQSLADQVDLCDGASEGDIVRLYTPAGTETMDSIHNNPHMYADVLVCASEGCNDPEVDPCRLSSTEITGTVSFGGDMSAAFTNVQNAVSSITASILVRAKLLLLILLVDICMCMCVFVQSVVQQTCLTCAVEITSITDAGTGDAIFPEPSRRLHVLSSPDSGSRSLGSDAVPKGSHGIVVEFIIRGSSAANLEVLQSLIDGGTLSEPAVAFLMESTGFENVQPMSPRHIQDEEHGPSPEVLAGVIIGAFAGLLMITLGVMLWKRKQNNAKKIHSAPTVSAEATASASGGSGV
jgi:hypothetical protein